MFIYPKNNQTPEQQKKDEYECFEWAKQQTGFDPMNPGASAAPVAKGPRANEGPGVIGGAAGGAAVGAVVGAIAGDAGKGAAAGAAGGGLLGGLKKGSAKRQNKEQRRAEKKQAKANEGGKADAYNRARAACLDGRGYTVR